MSSEVDWCKVNQLLGVNIWVKKFLTPEQQEARNNYLRAFNDEMERLGPGYDDEAVRIAKEREPVGFEVTMRVDITADSLLEQNIPTD